MGQFHTEPAYEKQMVSLGRILQKLREAQTAEEAIAIGLEHIQNEFDYELAWIGLYNRVHHHLVTKSFYCPKGSRPIRNIINLTPGDVMEQVVIQQRPLIVADLQNEARAGEWEVTAKTLGMQSTVLFPIRRQDTCFGILLLATVRWGLTPSPGERAHLSMLTGFLADALHQYAAEEQRRRVKQPDLPLFSLLERLNQIEGLDARLEAVVAETQAFLQPACTRIYWRQSQGNAFWLRTTSNQRLRKANAQGNGGGSAAEQILVSDIRGLYQVLCTDQLVVRGELQSSLTSSVTGPLMQTLNVQSFMAAPILYQGDLLGFISVEGNTPRIWQEGEKRFLQGVARLLAMAMPSADLEDTLRQVRSDQLLTSGVVRGIQSDRDWRITLEACAKELCNRLRAQHFIVLLFNEDQGGYELCFQSQSQRGRSVPLAWPSLDDVDWQMLERSPTTICVDDTGPDLKFMAWRPYFHKLNMASVMTCNVSPGNAPKGLVLVSDSEIRHWSPIESALLQTVSQQIGLILHQWQLQRQMDQQERIYESIQWGMRALQQTYQLDQLEQYATQHLAQILQVPLVALISWQPDQPLARVAQAVVHDREYYVDDEFEIPRATDAIIHWALQTKGILPLTLEELPDGSRQWLDGASGSKLLITALQTAPDHQPTAVMVAMGRPERRWSDYHLTILSLLTQQLAWSRRHMGLVEMLMTQREQLEQLNWYKQHQFEELNHQLSRSVERLKDLSLQAAPPQERYQQLVRQMESLLEQIQPSLEQERWQLQENYHTSPLISLLNRLMERMNPLIQERQLWTQVHNESNLIIGGDIPKIEFILYELFAGACLRSQAGDRIDLWCRQIDRQWLELSITDNGSLPTNLLDELKDGRPEDDLASSPLDEPPGLHFAICQALMQRMGGEFSIARLDDNRLLSRILLPIASASSKRFQEPNQFIGEAFSRRQGR